MTKTATSYVIVTVPHSINGLCAYMSLLIAIQNNLTGMAQTIDNLKNLSLKLKEEPKYNLEGS